jgi:hypothetical protein
MVRRMRQEFLFLFFITDWRCKIDLHICFDDGHCVGRVCRSRLQYLEIIVFVVIIQCDYISSSECSIFSQNRFETDSMDPINKKLSF